MPDVPSTQKDLEDDIMVFVAGTIAFYCILYHHRHLQHQHHQHQQPHQHVWNKDQGRLQPAPEPGYTLQTDILYIGGDRKLGLGTYGGWFPPIIIDS